MKCMMSVDGSNIVRVSDEKATELYHDGFRYVSKSVWKEKVRDVEKTTETINDINYMNDALKSGNPQNPIPLFIPTLCTEKKLKHEHEIEGKSPEGRDFHHHIGYSDNYHGVWSSRLQEIDLALQHISPLMFQFIQKMINYAENLNFEKAAEIRDRIKILEKKEIGINGNL